MKPTISKAFLHTGRDFVLDTTVSVKHPKIKDILDINEGFYCEEIYWAYVSNILSDPYIYMVFLDDRGIDYEEISSLDVLALRWEDQNEQVAIKKSLSFFLGERDYDIAQIQDRGVVIYDMADSKFAIGPSQFEWIVFFISQINCISDVGRIHPANKNAKRVLIEDMRDEIRRTSRKRKRDDSGASYIGDSITAVVYGSPSGVTPFNFEDLGIYQLLCGAGSTNKQMRVQSALNSIYVGMIEADSLSAEELRWT